VPGGTAASLRRVITGAAFLPHPPVLIPEVAQGAATELGELREACRVAIRRIVAPDSVIVLIGSGERWIRHGFAARGSLSGYGVPLEIPLGSAERGPVELPLSLTVGAWLLHEALGPDCNATGYSVGLDPASEPELPEPGADPYMPVSLLVMGDGSARRSTTAPGYLDERARDFDASVATALASGDAQQLTVDVELGDELLASGPRVWREAARLLGPTPFEAELLYDAAPYGVGYFVAAWTRRG
jgi:hypothetical protein